jgi:hypothetical protein
MSIQLLSSVISAISIIIGSLVGAYCTYKISQKMHIKQIQDEHKIIEDNRKYDQMVRAKDICNNANVIRLDIATAIYQSIRSINNNDEEKKYQYILPVNKDYSKAVASLSTKFDLKELSYLYQLYGIIEKVNIDILNWSFGDDDMYCKIHIGLKSILYKIYGNNVDNIVRFEVNQISYQQLYNNSFIKEPYKKLLSKLDYLCNIENYTSS